MNEGYCRHSSSWGVVSWHICDRMYDGEGLMSTAFLKRNGKVVSGEEGGVFYITIISSMNPFLFFHVPLSGSRQLKNKSKYGWSFEKYGKILVYVFQ